MVRETTEPNSGRVLRSTRNSRVQKSSNPASERTFRLRLRSRDTNIRHQHLKGDNQKTKVPRTKAEKPLPSYLAWSETDVSLEINRNSWLSTIPREIVKSIASYLPPESAVCLTLSCKLALRILGTTSWIDDSIRRRWYRDPDTRREHRPLFIELLSRDVKELGLECCARCNTLHPPLKKPREHQYTHLTKCCWGQNALIDYQPRGADGTGYDLVLEHIKHVLDSITPDSCSPIEYLSGSYEVPSPRFRLTVSSSGRYVNRNLILQRDYLFRPLPAAEAPLRAADVLSLPLRICPHQSTTTELPPDNRYLTANKRNGPLLTHAIASAFPTSGRAGAPKAISFRDPTVLEQRAMSAADRGEEVAYKCRSCPTKWTVEHGRNGGELKISVFHCFYREFYTAHAAWTSLVRREGPLLGGGKRNSEFWSRSKSSPDFSIE